MQAFLVALIESRLLCKEIVLHSKALHWDSIFFKYSF